MAKRRKSKASAAPAQNADAARLPANLDWRAIVLTTEEAGAAVKLGAERIRQLSKLGFVRKAGRDRFRLGDVFDGILAYREDQERKAGADTASNRLAAARKREVDLRIAQAENRLIDFEDVVAIHAEILGTFRSELGGVPAAATRDLAVRAEIEAALNAALDRCRKRFDEAEDAFASGGADKLLEGGDADAG